MDFFLLNKEQPKSAPQPPKQNIPSAVENAVRTDMNDSMIKRGDFIKMIYKEKGGYNMYKGYIGEIREYRKGQDYAMVILHAMVNMRLMRVPIDHFIKIDY